MAKKYISKWSKLKLQASNKIKQMKEKVNDKIQNFQQDLHQANISKQEAFLLGMSAGFAVVSLIYLVKSPPAFAKDKFNNGSKPGGPTQPPGQAVPPPPPPPPAQAPNGINLDDPIIKIYGPGFVYGFYFLGHICGLIVGFTIFKGQGK